MVKNCFRGWWVIDSVKTCREMLPEMRNLFSDFAGFGCGHAEPCRSSKRAILFSFLVHLSFLSGFRDYG